MTGAGRDISPSGPETEEAEADSAARPAARFGADVPLLVAVVVAAACSYSTTGRFFNQIAVGVGAVALLWAVLAGWRPEVRRGSVVAAAVISVGVQLYKPPIGNVARVYGFHGVLWLAALATALVGLAVLLPAGQRRSRLLGPALLLLGLMELAIVAWSHRPEIDVWQIFQQASAGLWHGVNPYAISYAHIPAGQTASCFNYLPATFLSVWPGWAIFDDVRYAEVAVLLAGFGVLVRTLLGRATEPAHRSNVLLMLGLAASLTGTLRVGQQAWNESLLLGFILLGVCALASGRTVWAVLMLGLALATKQHIALLLPVFVLWPRLGWRRTAATAGVAAVITAPWFFANPHRFKGCTVDFFVHGVARFDSISLWHFLPGPIAPAVPVLALLGSYLLVYRRIPRTPGGLLVGCALVLFAFDLFNKQSFENQWWFVCELLVCGLAFETAEAVGVGERPAVQSSRTGISSE